MSRAAIAGQEAEKCTPSVGHRELSRATILKLADSMPADEPLRKIFLSAAPVRKLLETGESTIGAGIVASRGRPTI